MRLIVIIFTFKRHKPTHHVVEFSPLTLLNSSSPRAIPSNPKAPANKLCHFEQIYCHWICCAIVLVLCVDSLMVENLVSLSSYLSLSSLTYMNVHINFFTEGCHIQQQKTQFLGLAICLVQVSILSQVNVGIYTRSMQKFDMSKLYFFYK